MNRFESDLRRAVLSFRFFFGAAVQCGVLWYGGFSSTLYQISVPLVCTFPYACGWLDEYQSGFVKFALVRGRVRGYIWGKYLACVLSGGGLEALGAWLYVQGKGAGCDFSLVFLNGALWAAVAALLAAGSGSRYLAYGGAFAACYFLVILCERYWQGLYCLHPHEWLAPAHAWAFGDGGVRGMLAGFLLVLGLGYYRILEERVSHV